MAGRTSNKNLTDWVQERTEVLSPAQVHWCDGSDEERSWLLELLVASGTLRRLADDRRPSSYLALSDPGDVARVEDRTFICSEREIDARRARRARQTPHRLNHPPHPNPAPCRATPFDR